MKQHIVSVSIEIKSEHPAGTRVHGVEVQLLDLPNRDDRIKAMAEAMKGTLYEIFGDQENLFVIEIQHLSGAAIDRKIRI